jgi:hypothetical protein
VSSSSHGFPPLKVTGITQIANVGRAEPGNLQFCDPDHLHLRQAVTLLDTPMEMATKEILVLVLALALAGGAATMVHAADRSPISVVAADYSGASW